MAKKSNKSNKKSELDFRHKLVLNRWIMQLLGVDTLQDEKISKLFGKLTSALKQNNIEGVSENNLHKYYYALTESELFPNFKISKELLLTYEENISSHTQSINANRQRPVVWKYFQWLTLLFVEIYLDKYFSDRSTLLADLNAFIGEFNAYYSDYAEMPKYELEDLNKVCFQNATGSGKTLIMHVNLMQFQHYANKYGKSKDLSRVILLTPNERLTAQHLDEFKESSIYAQRLEAGTTLFSNPQGYKQVDALEITKLSDKDGPNLIATRNLGSENLLLVDEGHRGMSSGRSSKQEEGVWVRNRNMLCENGFTFEYSATFEQSVAAAGDIDLANAYAKNILFDYSYRYFYEDGYGKDYQILNISNSFDRTYNSYLTACLLKYYQQLLIYQENLTQVKPYNIEKPLWVFVGSSVSKSGSTKDEKQVISDVAKIIEFIGKFLQNPNEFSSIISDILNGDGATTGLVDDHGNDIFKDSFQYLQKYKSGNKFEGIYSDIMVRVFQNAGGGKLIMERIKGDSGEVMLKCGTSDESFGLINVGDALGLCKHCEEHFGNLVMVDESEFSTAIFNDIKYSNSPVNLLIGSKKFIEGWDCWRVSTMGLMHVGQSEGSQIIQLFGRGVRLKGKGWSLKRSSKLGSEAKLPEYIYELETLNVFGVRADFMEKFKQFLANEGLPGNERVRKIQIPMNVTYDFGKQLKVLAPKRKSSDGKEYNFKTDAPIPTLGEVPEYLKQNKVRSDWYPRIKTIASKSVQSSNLNSIFTATLSDLHLSLIDYDKLYAQAEQFKRERSWYNLNIPRGSIEVLLRNNSWYELLIPMSSLESSSWQNVLIWQQAAEELIKRYCDRYYNYKKSEFFEPRMELREISSDDPNLPQADEQYHIIIEDNNEADIVIKHIEELKKEMSLRKDEIIPAYHQELKAINFSKHLFEPLLHLNKNSKIKVMPVALNDSEYHFVEDLCKYSKLHKSALEEQQIEFYLLRNKSRGRGIGFFEAGNFYPDFIFWIICAEKQYINFIDPHGMLTEAIGSPKIQFHEKIKKIEERIKSQNTELNSFILSPTDISQLSFFENNNDYEHYAESNILFLSERNIATGNSYIDRMLKKLGIYKYS